MAGFAPTTIREVFVLRLAHKTRRAAAAEHYADLAGEHADGTLLLAAPKNCQAYHPHAIWQKLHVELAAAQEQSDNARQNGCCYKVNTARLLSRLRELAGSSPHEVRNASKEVARRCLTTIPVNRDAARSTHVYHGIALDRIRRRMPRSHCRVWRSIDHVSPVSHRTAFGLVVLGTRHQSPVTHEDGDSNRAAFHLIASNRFCPCVVPLFRPRPAPRESSCPDRWGLTMLDSSSVRQQQSSIGVLAR